ncbi:MAG: HNH endonuclease [Actinobacteria bacterium]|nr:HNH endonuclease [Actinomycetota bacterium]
MHRNPDDAAARALALIGVLEAAGSELAELVAEGALQALPQAALPEVAQRLVRVAEPMNASAACAVAMVKASAVPLPDGHVSVSRWLQKDARVTSGAYNALVARGSALLGDYGATRTALLAGAISGDQARIITVGVERAVKSLPSGAKEDCRREGETFLLHLAGHLSPDELQAAVKHLRFVLDPDGADADEIEAHTAQHLVFTRVGDGVEIRGFLTAEAAAEVQTALDQIVEGWYRRGELPAGQQDAEGSDPDDPRTQRARRAKRPHLDALALVSLAGQALASGELGTKNGLAPRVTITADLATLATQGGLLHNPRQRTPEPVSPTSLARFLCDAAVTTVITSAAQGCPGKAVPADAAEPMPDVAAPVLSPEWLAAAEAHLRQTGRTVLYVGRERRTVSAAQRAAVAAIHPTCMFPGCDVPAARSEIHHVIPWAQNGPTDISHLRPVCGGHHHLVHEGGWRILATGDDPHAPDYWTVHPPDPSTRP